MKREDFMKIFNDVLAEKKRQDLFLVQFSVSSGMSIDITIDGDYGVAIEDCVFISRAIEQYMINKDEESVFALQVMSAGVGSPLVHKRQYEKNKGRHIKVKSYDFGELEAVLTDVDDKGITLQRTVREPKPIGKGKITVKKTDRVFYEDIIEASIVIKF